MNKSYKSILNRSTGTYVAASENVKSAGKSAKSKLAKKVASASLAFGASVALLSTGDAFADEGVDVGASSVQAQDESGVLRGVQATDDSASDDSAPASNPSGPKLLGRQLLGATQTGASVLYDDSTGDSISFAGAAGTRLSNVAAGTVSTDATNFGQLLGTAQSVATALGGGAAVDANGRVTAPTYTLGGTAYNDVGSALTGLDERTTSNETAISNLAASGNKYIGVGSAGNAAYALATAVAIGPGATATGNTSLALGSGTVAATNGSMAIGSTAKATGVNAQAIGSAASVSGQNSIAAGSYASASANQAAAYGYMASIGTSGASSVALGYYASANVSNAVALGAGSVANRANTVSVGKAGSERQVANVAAGTEGTDAVNYGQLMAAGLKTDTNGVATNSFVAYDSNTASTVTLNPAGTKIKNVAAGDVSSAASTDAVNGGQLFTTNQSVAENAAAIAANTGDIATNAAAIAVNTSGIAQNTSDIATNTSDIAEHTTAIAANTADIAANTSGIAQNTSDISTINTQVGTLNTQLADTVKYDSAAHDTMTLSGASGTKITNVAAGTLSSSSTDAVNGAQLYATNTNVSNLEATVSSLSAGGAQDSRIAFGTKSGRVNASQNSSNPAAASGADSVAIGGGSLAGVSGVAVGALAGAGSVSAAFGFAAQASGDYAAAFGRQSIASGSSSVAVGSISSALGTGSVALGNQATASATGAVALGSGSVADQEDTISVGYNQVQRRIVNVAAGTQGNDAVNLSQMQTALNNTSRYLKAGGLRDGSDDATIGTWAADNIAIGSKAIADTGDLRDDSYRIGQGAIAIGTNANAKAAVATSSGYEMAIGDNAVANIRGAVAVGGNASSTGDMSLSTGFNAQSSGARAVALGTMASASGASSVALGANSVATLANTVSVGSGSLKRQIVNVAAGGVSATSTDALNGSQLYASAASTATALGGGSSVNADGTISSPAYSVNGATVNSVGAAISDIDGRVTTNTSDIARNTSDIGTLNTQVGTINTQLADAVKYDSAAHDTMTLGGASGTKITNVAAGDISSADSTDAVNGSQLYATNQNVAANTTAIAANTDDIANNTSAISANTGAIAANTSDIAEHATAIAANTADIAANTSGIAQNTSDISTINTQVGTLNTQMAVAVKYDSAAHDTLTLSGASGTKITNVAAGDVSSANSTDAVNGGQLYATNQNVAQNTAAIAEHAGVIADNTSAISANTSAIAANTSDIAANAAEIATNASGIAQNASDISTINTQVGTINTQLADAVKYDSAAHDTMTLSGASGTKITNVAAGDISSADSTDAVNGSQLYATNQNVAQNTAAIAEHAGEIANNTSAISANTSAIAANTSDIAANTSGIAQNTSDIAEHATAIAANTADIAANTSGIAQNTSDIAAHATAIAANTADIATNTSGIAQNTSDISAINTQVGTINTQLADAVMYDSAAHDTMTLSGVSGTKITNVAAGDVSSADSTDAVNGSQLYATNQNVSANATAIAANTADIAANTSGIAQNTSDIAEHATAIAANTADIAANTSGIAQNTSDIAEHATAIAANTADIAANTSGIAQNTSDISTINTQLADAVKYDSTTHDTMTLSGASGTKITNVAAGDISSADSTDAVNGSQLYATNQNVADNATAIAANTSGIAQNTSDISSINTQLADAVKYDSAAHDTMTLSGVSGTKITNVAAGDISSADSTDAVNGSQLYATNQNVAANATAIAANTDDIASNTSAISANTSAIAANTSDIAEHATAIAANTADIAANTSGIAQNTSDIAEHATAIAANTADIAANTSGIAQNTSDISAINTQVGTINTQLADAVKYDSTTHDTMTLSGASGTKITNVAAGDISSADSTDAVNGSQLYATNQNVADNATAIAANTSDIALNTADIATNTSGIAQNTADIGTLNTQMADAVKYDAGSDHASMTLGGAAGTVIKNVAAGQVSADSMEAVNGSQLFSVQQSVGEQGAILADAVRYDSSSHDTITLGDPTAGPVALTNVKAGDVSETSTDAVNGSQLYTVSQDVVKNTADIASLNTSMNDLSNGTAGLVRQDPVTQALSIGANTNGDTISFAGLQGARVLTGVANGMVSSASQDAVNGSQLFNTSTSVAAALGGGASVDANGGVTAPSYTVGGKQVNDVGSAVSNLDGRVTQNSADIAGLKGDLADVSKTAANAVAYDSADHSKVTLGGTDASAGVKLTNVADGDLSATSTDAVNGSQLNATNARVSATESAIEQFQASGVSGSTATGDGAAAIGSNADASGTNSTAAGANAAASGDQSTAAGANSIASGGQSTATGANAMASGSNSTAAGANSMASGDSSVAFGGNAAASGSNAVSIGGNSQASGSGSVAFGGNSSATADNSVALGANSVADEANTVSVGSAGNERRVTNVAPGVNGTDATNVNQLNALRNDVNSSMTTLRRAALGGVAAAMAMPNLMPSAPGKTVVGAGVANYKGYNAFAAGATYRSENSRWLVNGAVSVTQNGDAGVRAQAGYEF